MSQLTTHILDTSSGQPAPGIEIILYQQKNAQWEILAKGKTNNDGRVADLLPKENILEPGQYKLKFETQPYFNKQNIQTFYPYVEISFQITDATHYHVPLLLNPFGYTTYRGS